MLLGVLSVWGCWVDSEFSWISGEWNPHIRYLRETLVSEVILKNKGLEFLCRAVYFGFLL